VVDSTVQLLTEDVDFGLPLSGSGVAPFRWLRGGPEAGGRRARGHECWGNSGASGRSHGEESDAHTESSFEYEDVEIEVEYESEGRGRKLVTDSDFGPAGAPSMEALSISSYLASSHGAGTEGGEVGGV